MAETSLSPSSPSPTSCPQPPNVQLIYGPMLIGVFINMILYGVLVTQVYSYYQMYKRDVAWIKNLVSYIFIVETINTGINMVIMYEPLILRYGQKLGAFPTLFAAEPITVVAVSTPIQLFFAWRIRLLTKQNFVAAVIALLSLVSFAGGLWTTILITIVKLFINKPKLHRSALVWFLSGCIADVMITIALVVNLSRRRTGFASTDDAISKIIRITVQTGMLTAFFAIADVVFFMALPHAALNFVWDLALTKVYANCLMSTLNSRKGIREVSTSRRSYLQNVSKISFNHNTLNLPEAKLSTHAHSAFEQSALQDNFSSSSARGNTEPIGVTVTKFVETMPESTKTHDPPSSSSD